MSTRHSKFTSLPITSLMYQALQSCPTGSITWFAYPCIPFGLPTFKQKGRDYRQAKTAVMFYSVHVNSEAIFISKCQFSESHQTTHILKK